MNKFHFRHAYADKGFYDTLFHDINRPQTIVNNVNGYYYDGETPITEAEALDRCSNLEGAIIKPSLGGTWGKGVKLLQSVEGTVVGMNCSVKQLFN